MSVPIVILHRGNQPYFRTCVLLNAKYNPVIVLGDDTNRDITAIPNVTHVPIDTLESIELAKFRTHFTNYSTNSASYEFLCFARVYYMRELMERKGLDAVFHTDSDCIVVERLDKIVPQIHAKGYTIAYSLQQSDSPMNMVGCIHNGLLTREFCSAFATLCSDIYINRTKLSLIEPKIKWHKDNRQNGGICDMTLYHLLASEGLLRVLDLNQILEVEGVPCTFDHNINIAGGYKGENTYRMKGPMKQIRKKEEQFFIQEAPAGQEVRALSFHFQGGAKPHMFQIYKNGNV